MLGRVIAGKLRVESLLGVGSMGRVYRAHHLSLEKDVAIKVLRESPLPDPTRSRRFAREAKAASRLNHPNSVAVLDFGEDGQDKLLYIAMELVRGEDLQSLIDRGTLLGVDRICQIMIQALAALAAAHDAGIIHRDMKPSNIVLVRQLNDEGEMAEVVKVCDFGVAKFQSGADTLDGGRAAQKVVGTPLYMSPEQATGDGLDHRTDLYSCGVIMYEMLTGQPPFRADTPMGVLMKHVSEAPEAPSVMVPGVPIELEGIILWALEKNRELRPGSARELRNALRAYLAGKAHTLPALARYGVEVREDATPWTGSTPLWPDPIKPNSTSDSPLLAAPPLPAHTELVEDLGLEPSSDAIGTEDLPDLLEALPGTPAAPPTGATVPPALLTRSSSSEHDPVSDEPEDRSDIFSDRSYFQTNRGGRITLADDGHLEAPMPRALSKHRESDSGMSRAATDKMASYLWERFGIAPERRVPSDGFWLRDALEREVGPLTWSELTRALRAEAQLGSIDAVAVAALDHVGWMAAERFADLTGVQALLWTAEAPQASTRFGVEGHLGDTSMVRLLGDVTRRRLSGLLRLEVRTERRKARFDLELEEGRPCDVVTNEPHLQLPNLLVTKQLVQEDRLPRCVRRVLQEAVHLEEAVFREAELDVGRYRDAVLKERLRHLLRWPSGQYRMVAAPPNPERKAPLGSKLLSLLPDLVYRALSYEQLEAELRPLMRTFLRAGPDAAARLDEMALGRSQRGVAERLLRGGRLDGVLPAEGRVRKAYTTMAYVLRELGLIQVDRSSGRPE